MAEATATARDREGVIDLGGRKAVRAMATIVTAVVLLQLAATAVWWCYSAWGLGHIELTNDGPPVTVQVLDESGQEPIGPPVELVTRTTLPLPDGEYRLRVTGSGRLGQTSRFAVNQGETIVHPITLDDNRLLGEAPASHMGARDPARNEPIAFTPNTVAIGLTPGKADFIEWSNTRLSRRDGATGKVVWDALQPRKPGKTLTAYHPWLLWFAGHARSVRLVEPAPDLDGDGTRDLVFTPVSGTAFLALSGKDGSVLWTYLAELDGPGGAYPEGPELPGPIRQATRPGNVVGGPSVGDVDRDGVPDLIATSLFSEFPAEAERRSRQPRRNVLPLYRRIVMAISGRSGKPLWSHAVDSEFTAISRRALVRSATIVPGRKASTVGIVEGMLWQGLDAATGRPIADPIELGFEPVRPVQYADLDGDGEPEILALGPATGRNPRALSAFSIASGRPLWTATVNAGHAASSSALPATIEWPLVVDLDGDGRSEIIVPDSGALDPVNGYRGLRMIDGSSGQPRWRRPMRPVTVAADGLVQIVEAPDLDGDGYRDLVALSAFLGRQPAGGNQPGPTEPERVYADALSGKDGRPLWWWHVDIPADQLTPMVPPEWWGRGPDGWPLLAVPLNGRIRQPWMSRYRPPSDPYPPMVTMLEASTGREVQTLRGFDQTYVADLDGDGLTDLWGQYQDNLRAFRGEGPEPWRVFGSFLPARDPAGPLYGDFRPAADLDGDGIGDLIAGATAPVATPGRATGSRTGVARSGRDGRLLWKTHLDVRRGWFDRDLGENYNVAIFPLPAGDLDGDGTPDVLVHEHPQQPPVQASRGPATLPLMVVSGRTGRPVWRAGPLPLDFEAHGFSRTHWAMPQVIEPNTAPDILVRHNSPFLAAMTTPPPPNSSTRDRLARVSGRTGRILWDIPLCDVSLAQYFGSIPPPVFHDLDGDGGLDVLVVTPLALAIGQNEHELKAVSLRDGRLMWSQPLTTAFATSPTVRIIESGEAHGPLVTVMVELADQDRFMLVVRAFDGRDGKRRWAWDGGAEYPRNRPSPLNAKMRHEGGKADRLGVDFQEFGGKRRIVVLGADGREVVRRDLPGEYLGLIHPLDLDGDGRDELLVWHADRLRAWDQDLKELWSWPDPSAMIDRILPASAGRPSGVTLFSGLSLDGRTGQPRWRGQAGLAWSARSPDMLDPGDSTRLPLLVSFPTGATIGRMAMPAAPDGSYAPPRGTPVPPGLPREDPRWTRPLPWTEPIVHRLGLKGFAVLVGLALVNVMVPLGILRLASWRRVWSVRALMALPVAAAVPLWVFQTFEPAIPDRFGSIAASARLVFVLGTLAGIPIVLLAGTAAWSLVRGRWKPIAWMAGLTVVASSAIAAAWLWADSRTMPAIEHFSRSGWPLVLVPGAYVVGILLPIAWTLRRAYRWLRRPRRPEVAVP